MSTEGNTRQQKETQVNRRKQTLTEGNTSQQEQTQVNVQEETHVNVQEETHVYICKNMSTGLNTRHQKETHATEGNTRQQNTWLQT